MSELQNVLRWSYSRRQTLESCRRRYFHEYYGSWEGWKPEAPERIRRAYCLKQIVGVDAYIGTLVHQEIGRAVQSLYNGKTPKADTEAILAQLDQAFKQSKQRAWVKDVKRIAMFGEDFYGPGFTPQERAAKKEKARICLEQFMASELYRRLVVHAGEFEWLRFEVPHAKSLPSFTLDGIEVIAKLDLAIRSAGRTYIWDFKTGRAVESEAEQMACYGLYAVRTWGCEPDDVVASVVSLHPTIEVVKYPLTRESLDEMADSIRSSYAEMKALADDGDKRRESAFPTSESGHCDWCNFTELCDGPGCR